MGTLLIPQRQLSRQLGVLIDTRFDLQRAVYQLVFREVVDYRRTILCTVTASSNPANQVVPVGRRERQNLNELGVGSIVGVDDDLNAVPHIINRGTAESVMRRIGVAVRRRERVDNPEKPPAVTNDDVGVRIVSQEWR